MPVDNSALERWRSISCESVLAKVADHAKPDTSFEPVKDARTTRWHACVRGQDFELLLTGSKFWDARAQIGGGGAVDLVMHVRQCTFREAVAHLRTCSL